MSANKLINTEQTFCLALAQIVAEPDRLAMRRPSWSEGLTVRFHSEDKQLCWFKKDWNYFLVTISGGAIMAADWEIWEVTDDN